MIYNTTYTNEDFLIDSNLQLGKPFALLERVKMKGIGSKRFIIADVSEKLSSKEKQFSELSYGNIELRPKGIILHFNSRLSRFSWCIPYYKLVVYNASVFSIHAEGSFIKFRKDKNYIANKKFINKMIDYKNEFLQLGYYDY